MPPLQTPQGQLVRVSTDSAPPTSSNAVTSKIWAHTFPEQVETAAESLKFMQKLLAVGVSSVAFLRSAFPKEAFKEGKSLGKVPIRLLKANNPIKEAGDLAAYVLSAMDALALKYLRELHFVIHENDNMSAVLEVYTFRYILERNPFLLHFLT